MFGCSQPQLPKPVELHCTVHVNKYRLLHDYNCMQAHATRMSVPRRTLLCGHQCTSIMIAIDVWLFHGPRACMDRHEQVTDADGMRKKGMTRDCFVFVNISQHALPTGIWPSL